MPVGATERRVRSNRITPSRLLELLDRRAERRLADEAGFRRLAEMAAIGERDQKLELAERGQNPHKAFVIDFNDQYNRNLILPSIIKMG